jgi:transposase-like protein
MKTPATLQEAIVYFSDLDNATNFFAARRWPNGVECPTCGSKEVRYISTRRLWECKTQHARKQFSVKVGSIFEDSALGMDKWLTAAWMICSCKNGVSSCEIARSIGVTQKTAWFMAHRIRKAMQTGSFMKLGGPNGGGVEVDETFIGGKARDMHIGKRERRVTGTGTKDKTSVLGILERGGDVKPTVVPTRKKKVLQAEVRKHVEVGTDLRAFLGYVFE